MNAPTQEAVRRLIGAAEALLEARDSQMVTAIEWDALQRAVVECGGRVPAEPDRE